MGLPGEEIAIRGGELFVNGLLWQKSLAEERALGTLVYDDDFASGARWRPATEETGWQRGHGPGMTTRYTWIPERTTHSDYDWLVYHHRRTHAAARHDPKPGGVLDEDPHNPSLSRQLNEVFDLRLELTLDWNAEGMLALRGDDGCRDWQAELDGKKQEVRLVSDGAMVACAKVPSLRKSNMAVALSLCDRTVRLAIEGEVALETENPPGEGMRRATATPLAIGGQGDGLRVRQLRVYRDVYWLNASQARSDQGSGGLLGRDAYYVLGDNQPASTDSRHFGAVQRGELLGIVWRQSPASSGSPTR
jgi:hypothetical protein